MPSNRPAIPVTTDGKNATDSAMIIDAMDIALARVVEGFCLVSSDSDYPDWLPASARRVSL